MCVYAVDSFASRRCPAAAPIRAGRVELSRARVRVDGARYGLLLRGIRDCGLRALGGGQRRCGHADRFADAAGVLRFASTAVVPAAAAASGGTGATARFEALAPEVFLDRGGSVLAPGRVDAQRLGLV